MATQPQPSTSKTRIVLADLLAHPDAERTAAAVAESCATGMLPVTVGQVLGRLVTAGYAVSSSAVTPRLYRLNPDPARQAEARTLVEGNPEVRPVPAPNQGEPIAVRDGVEVWTLADLAAATRAGRVPAGVLDKARRSVRPRR